jgi:hypothetical protein
VNTPSFEDLVRIAIYESVEATMGDEAWRALNFYFDTSSAARNPERFARLVDSLFGASSGELQRRIVRTLLSKMGRPVPPIIEGTRLDDWYSGHTKRSFSEFQDWIRRARDTFSSQDRSIASWSNH